MVPKASGGCLKGSEVAVEKAQRSRCQESRGHNASDAIKLKLQE